MFSLFWVQGSGLAVLVLSVFSNQFEGCLGFGTHSGGEAPR